MLETQQATDSAPAEGSVRARILNALSPLAGQDPSKVVFEQAQVVGPAIGSQLRMDAFKAVLYSFVFMIMYLWFRYSFVFGVTGVIALIHDTLTATACLVFIRCHIDMTVIAAVLTIIGYSINDTVVIYDRIREDMKMYAGRGWSYMQIMNQAINQTLSRTLLTSGCTLLSVIMLLVFGGQVLRDFAFYLTVGIVVGTYSSIAIASALAYDWQTWWKKRQTAANAAKAKQGGNRRSGGGGKEKEAAV
jgi:preprotein translocase SecF subunit